jgi:hypothetical protein
MVGTAVWILRRLAETRRVSTPASFVQMIAARPLPATDNHKNKPATGQIRL